MELAACYSVRRRSISSWRSASPLPSASTSGLTAPPVGSRVPSNRRSSMRTRSWTPGLLSDAAGVEVHALRTVGDDGGRNPRQGRPSSSRADELGTPTGCARNAPYGYPRTRVPRILHQHVSTDEFRAGRENRALLPRRTMGDIPAHKANEEACSRQGRVRRSCRKAGIRRASRRVLTHSWPDGRAESSSLS